MAMSRRDYAKIADIVNDNLADTMVESRAVAGVARELADYFKSDNSNFRFDTFFEACGLDPFGDVIND